MVNVLLAPARHICGVGAAILRATGSNLATEAMMYVCETDNASCESWWWKCELEQLSNSWCITGSLTSATEISPQSVQNVGGRH